MLDMINGLVCAGLVGGVGTWLACAAYDNWKYPTSSAALVRDVMRLQDMERDYPEDFASFAHRRVKNEALIKNCFILIRWSETIVACCLILSAFALSLSAFSVVSQEIPKIMASISLFAFIQIWVGFIVGGNYFVYWYCHGNAQLKHFILIFWGILVLIVLSLYG